MFHTHKHQKLRLRFKVITQVQQRKGKVTLYQRVTLRRYTALCK
jgi:hypothetical protein